MVKLPILKPYPVMKALAKRTFLVVDSNSKERTKLRNWRWRVFSSGVDRLGVASCNWKQWQMVLYMQVDLLAMHVNVRVRCAPPSADVVSPKVA